MIFSNMYGIEFLLIFFTGFNACYLMDLAGICNSHKGVEYYGQIHQTTQNIIVHVIGMPFTVYGILLWVPTLVMCTPENAWQVQAGLYLLYLGHYIRMDLETTKYVIIMFSPAVLLSFVTYTPGLYGFGIGFAISFVALVFQEVIGHYMSGDKASRIEGVPNAVLYAIYFSADSLKRLVQGDLH